MVLRGSVIKRIVILMFVSTLSGVLFLRFVPRILRTAQEFGTGDTRNNNVQIDTGYAQEKILQNHNSTRSTLLFVGIYSAPRHHERRIAIRETWMKKCVGKDRVVCWFITDGQDVEGRPLTGPVRTKLDNESSIHGDMLLAQSPGGTNFARRYIWMAQWARERYDFQYILRIDDDYFVCFNKLLLELEFHRPKQKLVWGWLHCYKKGTVAIDEGFVIVTWDIIYSILDRINSTLLCHPFGGQAMGIWLKDYPGLKIFDDNKRLFHAEFDSKENAAKRKEICQTALGIHRSYPEEMKIYWNITKKEPENSTYVVPPVTNFCRVPLGIDYKMFRGKWFAVPKLCKDNPVWNKTFLGRSGDHMLLKTRLHFSFWVITLVCAYKYSQ